MNLTTKEAQLVQTLVGTSNKTLFVGIAELLLSSGASKEDWSSMVRPGVICLIKDLEKDLCFIWVISMTKGKVIWKQNVDDKLKSQRRRRWIFVFEGGFRKLMLNFVDDDEADQFSYILYEKFPRLRKFDGVITYNVAEDGKIVRQRKSKRQSRDENLIKFINFAGLDKTILDDPTAKKKVEDMYGALENEVDDLSAILDATNYEEYTSTEEEEEEDEERDDETEEDSEEEEDVDYGDELILHGTPEPSPDGNKTDSEDVLEHEIAASTPLAAISEEDDVKGRNGDNMITASGNIPKPPPMNIPTAPSINMVKSMPPIPKAGVRPSSKKEGGDRGSLLEQIRNPKFALKKVDSEKNKVKSNKRLTKSGEGSLEHVLFGAMQQLRAVKADYGIPDDTYRDWED